MVWYDTVDFLVVGSGAAGMTAAIRAHDLGAKTLIIEKGEHYGGSTALSGGVVWVPDNPCMQRLEMEDSVEEGLEYLQRITEGVPSEARLRAYLETAPRMMRYLEEHSDLSFQSIEDYPDYYPESPGGKSGGRSCEPHELNGLELGPELENQGRYHQSYLPLGFVSIRAREGKEILQNTLKGQLLFFRLILGFLLNVRARLRGWRNTRLAIGAALVGRARLSLMKRDVPLWLKTKLIELVVEDGRVVGAIVEHKGRVQHIRAKQGVLLATGGFEHNAELRRKHQQSPIGTEWTGGIETNSGDAMAMGHNLRAGFELLDDAWWCPVFRVPGERFVRLVIYEKNLPGSIIVNARGERFMNEAAPYNDVVKSMYRANVEAASIPAYLIFDRRFRRKYPVAGILPADVQPDFLIPKPVRSWVLKDKSLTGLAQQIGADAEGLLRTVQRFNEFAREGKDLDFGRGESVQDHYYAALPTGPNPCLGPIEKGPFYAIQIWPGDLGTKGGLKTDEQACVLTEEGAVIPGLYAAGNCSAAVMGPTYPGAGGTIGPAMVFGFIAAENALCGKPPLAEKID